MSPRLSRCFFSPKKRTANATENAERMRCESTLHRMYFWMSQLCVCVCGVEEEAGEGCLVTKCLVCVAYFPGFDLPWMHRCEQNEDELERRGCPLGRKSKKKETNWWILVSFLLSVCLFLAEMEVSSRGSFGQHTSTPNRNRRKWITQTQRKIWFVEPLQLHTWWCLFSRVKEG